ncbi:hypothetical protein B0T21DRAFT_281647 [Apiosordaria backusii]|uniref:Uncharacterized protein n=1 Tax=Apiosordaria backusii TaxID=314023 RepID=A0AA40K3M1_9PEZI|nr:hypothetical protein B0T21DRAFT_281647 [Apiosordaria backusii]
MLPPLYSPLLSDREFGLGLGPLGSQGEGIRTLPLPGVRCQTCAENGNEVWVIPGRQCGYCRTPAPNEDSGDGEHDH